MRTSKLTMLLFAALCCLLLSSQAQAQHAYGYASITFDENTNTVTGYASTEVDYETAYYYDAEVQAHIEDENGNVLASGSGAGNPSAFTVLDVFQALLCIRFSIISYVVVTPRFLGCDGGYFDYFGFSDFWWGTYWDYGDFYLSPRNRCIFGRLIFIATIIADVLECLPADFNCTLNTRVLPAGFRPGIEFPFVEGSDKMTITCRVTDQFGSPMSNLRVRFGFDNTVIDSGGHELHDNRTRPRGTLSPTSPRTNGNGEVTSEYTAPHIGGTTRVVMTVQGAESEFADIYNSVPGLMELPHGENYRRFGGTDEHPFNHYAQPRAVTGLQQIADDYKALFFPDGWIAPPQGTFIDSFDGPTDYYKIHYNDISLRHGGKFDLALRWANNGEHDEHRIGINCDTRSRNIPADRHARLRQIFNDRGSTRTNDETGSDRPHWHLRFEFGQQAPRGRASNPVNGTPAAVPGRVEVEQFDVGANGEAYSVPGSGFAGIEKGSPDVSVYTAADGSSYVGSTFGGQWMNYTVNINSSGSYTFAARVASPSGGNTFHFEVDGVDKTGPIYIPATGSWEAFQFVTVDDVWLDAGEHIMRLVIDGAGQHFGNFDYFSISPYSPPTYCSPEWWEIQNCQNSGGYWDYGLCYCNYGPIHY